MEFSSARWQTIFKFNKTVYGRSLIVTSHIWTCKVLLSLLLLSSRDENFKKFPKFRPDHAIARIQQLQCYHKWLETKENLSMNVVNEYGEKRNDFAEVVAFCHVTCRYLDRFLLQGVDKNWRQACLFYLAPGLIFEGYWQVNSRRSIFRIADPKLARNDSFSSPVCTRARNCWKDCLGLSFRPYPAMHECTSIDNLIPFSYQENTPSVKV